MVNLLEGLFGQPTPPIKMNDPINPCHYKGLFALKPYETIMVSRQLDFCAGNYYKYLARLYQKDDPVQDFHKARWYMEDWVANHRPNSPIMSCLCKLLASFGKDMSNYCVYDNPNGEKARIAFDLIVPPAEPGELRDRYMLLKVVTEAFIEPSVWRRMLDDYEKTYFTRDQSK